MNIPATIYIVDDDPAVRDSLQLLIEQEGVAVHAFDGAESFLAACSQEWRGCAVIDVRMPGMNGLQLHEELIRRGIHLAIVFLTGHGDIPMSVKAIKAGAVDFLTKPVTAEALLASVRTALMVSEEMYSQTEMYQLITARLASLTERERQVMLLAVAGHPNKEIARRLGISHRTVEIHKGRIMQKTGAATLLDLARLVQEAGLS
jgi:RNA polymerase sigma factor (sigma-70 family)